MIIGKQVKINKDGSANFAFNATDKELGEMLTAGVITIKTCHLEFTEQSLKDLMKIVKSKSFQKQVQNVKN